jgi:hypothetical protein
MPRSSILALLVALSLALLFLCGCSDSSSPPAAESVTLRVFDQGSQPVAANAEWTAFRDGDQPWTVLAPSATGVYTGTVTDAKGRFGFACFANGDLHLQHGTVAEGTDLVSYLDTGLSLAKSRRIVTPGYHGIHGTIGYDFTPGESMVSMNRGRSSSSPIASYWFTVQAGLHDLVVSDDNGGSPRLVNWLYIERGLDVQSEVTHNVTVAAAQRILLEDGASLQVTGDASSTSAAIGLLTANGTLAMLADYDVITAGAAVFRNVPTAAMVSGDRYEVRLSRGHVQKIACFGSAAGMTMSAPTGDFPTFQVGTVDAGGSCYPIFAGMSMSNGKGYFMYCGAGAYFIDAIVSSGWLVANDTTSYQVPNLTGLAGWQAGWSIPAGTAITDLDAVFFNGNVALATCVRHHFSQALSPLAAGEWVSTTWED